MVRIMSPRVTKSKHLDKYPCFFDYDDPKDIPFDLLAEKFDVDPNLLRGMMRSAKLNGTIYAALRQMGFDDHQIPGWFARPEKPSAQPLPAPADAGINAAERSDAEQRSERVAMETKRSTIYVAQVEGAERPSALSRRSAPPTFTYRLVQPVYQPPMSPMLEEAQRRFIETVEGDAWATLNRMMNRLEPPKPPTPKQLMAVADSYHRVQQIEAQRAAQMLFMTNMLRPTRNSKRIDVEELVELFKEPFKEKMSREAPRGDDAGGVKTIKAMGDLLKVALPDNSLGNNLIQRSKAVVQERHDSDKEARIEMAKIWAENRRRRKMRLRSMERQNRRIMENYWKVMRSL